MPKRQGLISRLPGLLVFLAGLVLAVVVAQEQAKTNGREQRAVFERRVERTVDALKRRIIQYEKGVRGARGAIVTVGADRLDRATFLRYSSSRNYPDEFPGARGFGFIRRVPVSDEAHFLQRLRHEARSHQAIRFLAPHAGDRWVIEYIEPEANNLPSVGLDIASESNRREALSQTIDSGEATLTHPITLQQASGKTNQGFLLMLPIYHLDDGSSTGDAAQVPPTERQARAVALVYVALVIEEVLADFTLAQDHLTIALDDLDNGQPKRFYSTHANPAGAQVDALIAHRDLSIYGRDWRIELVATPAFVAALPLQNPLAWGLAIAVISVLIGLALNVWLTARQRQFDQLAHELAVQRQHQAEIQALNASLEARVAERTAKLQVSLNELQSLSYALAHDLTTPLRAIDGFSSILLAEQAGMLDTRGRDYLRRIRAAAQRMGHLIDDLLSLPRLSSHALRYQPVDLSQIAASTLEHLQNSDPKRQVEWHVAPGLVAHGDPQLLSILLEKLISNAWKYTVKTIQPRITIDQVVVDGENAFYVRDNGAGFDMAYADKLFNPFQRMHHIEEFDGRGIGLATAQRIIQRHAGRIWAKSAVGQGASLYFTLPKHSSTVFNHEKQIDPARRRQPG